MNICVVACWRLGSLTAACLASFGHHVTAFDTDAALIDDLAHDLAPVEEPGLDALLAQQRAEGRLVCTTDPVAVADSDVVWITHDTRVGDDDRPDTRAVAHRIEHLLPRLAAGTLVLLSSQLPVGTTARLEAHAAEQVPELALTFGVIPENLRLGAAIDAFTDPERVVAGLRVGADRARVAEVLHPIAERIEWVTVESAEMVKHALNAFLATSVALTNELAVLCEHLGADGREVEATLRSDPRIGRRAYVSAGTAFAGKTLGRDVATLSALGVPMHVIGGVRAANDAHAGWALATLEHELGTLTGRRVAILGLTYKPGTSTLRRSARSSWAARRRAAVPRSSRTTRARNHCRPRSLGSSGATTL